MRMEHGFTTCTDSKTEQTRPTLYMYISRSQVGRITTIGQYKLNQQTQYLIAKTGMPLMPATFDLYLLFATVIENTYISAQLRAHNERNGRFSDRV